MSDLDAVRAAYLAVNGDHPMSEADDAYVRANFVPADEESLRLMLAGVASLPAYVLSDGTPMVPEDHLAMVRIAGGAERVHDWFVSAWGPDAATGEAEWAGYLSGRRVDLCALDPIGFLSSASLLAQARSAIAVLAEAPADVDARASLWEAVEGNEGVRGLTQVLRPMTAYDRLRFDGPAPYDLIGEVRERWFSPEPAALPIRTERLVLRAPQAADSAAMASAYADEAFCRWLLTGTRLRAEVDVMFDHYSRPSDGPHRLMRIVLEHEGRAIGDVLIILQGVGLLTAELGWTLHPAYTGRGFATEAARAAIEIAFTHYGVHRVTANLDADNLASAGLAERLGMRRELAAVADFWSKQTWTSSYTYALLADEWRAGRESLSGARTER